MDVLWKPTPWRHTEGRAWAIDDCGGCRVRGGGGGGNDRGGCGLFWVVENRAGTEESFLSMTES